MRRRAARFLCIIVLLFLTPFAVSAEQGEILLAKMKVVREINLGAAFEYEVESAGRGLAILKTPPYKLKTGELINLFVTEGASESGKPAYMTFRGESARPFSGESSARSFKEGFAAVKLAGGWYFIDKNGKLLTQRKFDRTGDFQEGFALCELKNDYVFIGKDGELLNTPLILPRFPISSRLDATRCGFSEGVAVITSRTNGGKEICVIADKTGAVTKRAGFGRVYEAYALSEGLSAVRYETKKSAGLFGYMDVNAQIVIPAQFAEAVPFREGLAAAGVKGSWADYYQIKWGFIDKSGKFVIEPKYDEAKSFSEGRAAVKSGGKWGFIDKNGNITANIFYDGVRSFSEGLAAVKRGNYWGCIDKNGRTAVKFLFDDIKPFADGLAAVKDSRVHNAGLWGFIDRSGKFAIKPRYEEAESFSDGLALVAGDAPWDWGIKYTYIDANGQAALWFYLYR